MQSLTVMLTKIPKEKLWVNPDCGLKTRGVPEADASLLNMVKAAEEIQNLQIRTRCFKGDDIRIHIVDGRDDVGEFTVAHMGVNLQILD